MSETESDVQTENTPRFSKAMIGRVAAVGVFVVLGTFAVIQSMGSAKHEDDTVASNGPEKANSGPASDADSPEISKATDPLKTAETPTAYKPFTLTEKSNPEKPPAAFQSSSLKGSPTNQAQPGNKTKPTTEFGALISAPIDRGNNSKNPKLTTLKKAPSPPPQRFAQRLDTPVIASDQGFQVRNALPKPKTDPLNTTGNDPIGNVSNPSSASTLLPSLPDSGLGRFAASRPQLKTTAPPLSPVTTPSNNFGNNPTLGKRPIGLNPTQNPGFAPATTIGSTAQNAPALPALPARNFNPQDTSRSQFGASPFDNQNKAGTSNNPAQRSAAKSLGAPPSSNRFGAGISNGLGDSAVPVNPSTRSPVATMTPSRPLADPLPTRSSGGLGSLTKATQASTPIRGNPNGDRFGSIASPLPMTATNLSKSLPGDRQFEGVQAPALTIEKLSPREIQLNRPADFQIVVKNVGRVTAEDVRVFDQIPTGTEFLSAAPEPNRSAQSQNLQWNLGKLRPGQEKRIRIKLKPTRPGEIGSVAHITFSSQASMRTLVTKPVLEIVHQTRQSVLIGDDVIVDVMVKNKGDGPAQNVLIQEDVPKQLEFQDGFRELEYEVGTLMPGQSKRIRLALKAANIGKFRNVMFVTGDGGLQAQHGLDMEIVAPKLLATTSGPTKRFLQRNVTHKFKVANKGTASATNVELVARLPGGLRFISANNQGRYVASQHAVFWSLPELAHGIDADVELKTVPVEVGNQPIKFEAIADLNTQTTVQHALSVQHHVDVFFSIDDVVDPIEIGADTRYRIRIVNQGTKTATDVNFQVDFPSGIEPTSVDGSLRHRINGQSISFDPINSLAPGDEISVVVHGKGTAAGDHCVVLTMKTDGRSTPVSREETTRVYSDH